MSMAVIQIVGIMKDCYHIQSTVAKQQLNCISSCSKTYLGIKSWLQYAYLYAFKR